MLVRRVLLMLFLIWLTITVVFFIIRLIPGNPIEQQLLQDVQHGMSYQTALHEVEALYNVHLNQPLLVQYVDYVLGMLHGQFGKSVLFPNATILQLIGETLPWTFFTVATSIVISFVIGIILGTYAAYHRGGWADKVLTPSSSVLNGIPNYLIGTILLFVFAIVLGWFPTQGAYSPGLTEGPNGPFILSVLRHAALPIGSYVIASYPGWVLLMKSNAVSVLGSDFIAGARSHGISSGRIMMRYVAPNSILPMVTNLILNIAFLFGGSVFVETIFDYPGIGYLFTQAAANADYSLLQALFGVLTIVIILANFIADLLYTRLDPRITLQDIA